MAARIGHLALSATLISLAGCAMCANPFDCQYAAYGGRLPRADMVNGRVGSILDPASGGVLSTQEIQPGEIHDADAVTGDVYQESSDQEDTVIQQRPDVEMREAPPSTDEPLMEPPDALDMGFESDPNLGKDEIDRAFDAIQNEFPTRPRGT